jgi:hypothetical protein
MRSAAHVSALSHVFSNGPTTVVSSAVTASLIYVTPDILKEYEDGLDGNTSYMAWFACMQSENRILLGSVQNASTVVKGLVSPLKDYAAASYLAGGSIFTSSNWPCVAGSSDLKWLGVKEISVNNSIGKIFGDNPVESIPLTGGGQDDFSIIDRYFLAEDEVVVYDKYVNQNSMDFLLHIVGKMTNGSILRVFTTNLQGNNRVFVPQILSALSAANPNVSVFCDEVSVAFRQLVHDRYIFCGRRLQMVFSAGLDCFGPLIAGVRVNKLSEISIYSVDGNNILNIESMNGSLHSVWIRG